MTTITVSNLPNINFYTGQDARFGGESVENRRYGAHSDYYGDLGLSSANNSYWNGISNSTFSENPTNYYNIGDIINATISYMNKFKNNNVDINVNKNILTFNYKYETDLNSDFNNTSIIPASQLIDLLLNVNDMTFNKRHYYGNNIELKEVSYARKKYPYNGPNTILTVNDESSETGFKTYDFSKQFVDYKYSVLSYDEQYTRSYMEPYVLADGTIAYRDTGMTYIETQTFYSYEINDINELNNRINTFFDNNTERVDNKYKKLKSYYISDLDTVLTLTLNTYSLSQKNLYAYFNFSNIYDNWFDNSIAFTMNTNNINLNDKLLSIEPKTESWFNIITNEHDMPCGKDIQIDSLYNFKIINKSILEENQIFKIINPSNIKTLDLSENTNKITNINLINNYNKKIDVHNVKNTNWISEGEINLENLIIGNNEIESNVENIFGINNLITLKKIDITNCNNLRKDFSISKLTQLEEFKAKGSNIKIFIPHANNEFNTITLPDTLKTLILKNNTINNFDYEPTGNLINLTLENIQGEGINVQTFIETWINALENTQLNNIDVLHAGIIQNTNLVGINFENFDVNTLLKFKYLGLNKFEGIIGIKGDYLTRKEYLALRNEFGDEIMETGKYTSNSKPIKFEYILDPNAYKKKLYLYYEDNNYGWFEEIFNESPIHTANIIDNTGGNSLLDYFETIDRLDLTMNDGGFGYEVQLSRKIYTDNNDKSSLTKKLNVGDIVLYKGNKLIFVTKQKDSVYNYIKLGTLSFSQRAAENIIISFTRKNPNDL